MKLENEHIVGGQTPPRKSYNPFDSDDEDTDTYSKSNMNGFDIKSFETTDDSLTFHLDSSDLSWEEAILRHSRMLGNSVDHNASIEEAVFRKDTELFTDKTITECEMPESVFSYKDSGFHSVKDIGIDEGVHTHEKVWVKTRDGVGPNDDVKVDSLFEEGVKSQLENDVEKGHFGPTRSEDSVKENGLVHEGLDKMHSDDQCKTDGLVKVNEFEHELTRTEIESNPRCQVEELVKSSGVVVNGEIDSKLDDKDGDYHEVEKTRNNVDKEEDCNGDLPLNNAEKLSIELEVEADTESNKNASEEIACIQPVKHQEPSTNTMAYNSKVESGSIILDFNAVEKVSGEKKEENLEKNKGVDKPPESQTMSRDNGGDAGQSMLESGTDKRVHGETSFSASMPPPASITYMGPHVHNGSISLRSESSTGSTRSFAFPVLQAEWNSSPVRMAKADQRHFRKEKGWVHSLICCKF